VKLIKPKVGRIQALKRSCLIFQERFEMAKYFKYLPYLFSCEVLRFRGKMQKNQWADTLLDCLSVAALLLQYGTHESQLTPLLKRELILKPALKSELLDCASTQTSYPST